MLNQDKYAVSYQAAKRNAVRTAIKQASTCCNGNFEIPMCAIQIINKDNSLRKKPIRASYDYVHNMTYDMIRNNEIWGWIHE